MKRLALALSAIVVGVVVSSCAVGVRQPATNITTTGATLNGMVLSTTGGAGSWFIEYGPTTARTERTPTRTINFVGQVEPVSEPVSGLEPGTIYHFAVCAEDSENPGDPFCSPDQTFTTDFDPVLALAEHCVNYPPSHGLSASLSGMPPNAPFVATVQLPDGFVAGPFNLTTDSSGSGSDSGFRSTTAGTWTVTVTWSGGTLAESLFIDCAEPTPT
jgi:hypothetical protein